MLSLHDSYIGIRYSYSHLSLPASIIPEILTRCSTLSIYRPHHYHLYHQPSPLPPPLSSSPTTSTIHYYPLLSPSTTSIPYRFHCPKFLARNGHHLTLSTYYSHHHSPLLPFKPFLTIYQAPATTPHPLPQLASDLAIYHGQCPHVCTQDNLV